MCRIYYGVEYWLEGKDDPLYIEVYEEEIENVKRELEEDSEVRRVLIYKRREYV